MLPLISREHAFQHGLEHIWPEAQQQNWHDYAKKQI